MVVERGVLGLTYVSESVSRVESHAKPCVNFMVNASHKVLGRISGDTSCLF